VYAVISLSADAVDAMEARFSVERIFYDIDLARHEASRLNDLSGVGGTRHWVQATRLFFSPMETDTPAAADDLATLIESAGEAGADRAIAFESGGDKVLAIADGAGGMPGGAEAADEVMAQVMASVQEGGCPRTTTAVCNLLRSIDFKLRRLGMAGETTAVLAVVTGAAVLGASVGDSAAWIVSDAGIVDLTSNQHPKPLLGSGDAEPKGFGPVPLHGQLLLATDGLIKHTQETLVCQTMLEGWGSSERAKRLLELARQPNGRLQDDVGIAVYSPKIG